MQTQPYCLGEVQTLSAISTLSFLIHAFNILWNYFAFNFNQAEPVWWRRGVLGRCPDNWLRWVLWEGLRAHYPYQDGTIRGVLVSILDQRSHCACMHVATILQPTAYNVKGGFGKFWIDREGWRGYDGWTWSTPWLWRRAVSDCARPRGGIQGLFSNHHLPYDSFFRPIGLTASLYVYYLLVLATCARGRSWRPSPTQFCLRQPSYINFVVNFRRTTTIPVLPSHLAS